MAFDLNPSTFLNPSNVMSSMAALTDLGLRALDMTVSSAQSISESADRLTRAGAGVEPGKAPPSGFSRPDEIARDTPSAVSLAVDLQRSTFDLMTQAWLQWMSTLGSLAAFAAGQAGQSLTNQNLPLDKSLTPAGWAETFANQARSFSSWAAPSGSARRTKAASRSMDHAFASGEPKRRRSTARAKPKARRSRRT